MLINPIASGSSGNAYYISDGQSSLLLDAGIPLAQIQAGCGYKVSQLSGCLVTHGHGDHVKAAKALARMGVNIYTSQGTADMANLTGTEFARCEHWKASMQAHLRYFPLMLSTTYRSRWAS